MNEMGGGSGRTLCEGVLAHGTTTTITAIRDILEYQAPNLQPKDVLGCMISDERKRMFKVIAMSMLDRYGRVRERNSVYLCSDSVQ